MTELRCVFESRILISTDTFFLIMGFWVIVLIWWMIDSVSHFDASRKWQLSIVSTHLCVYVCDLFDVLSCDICYLMRDTVLWKCVNAYVDMRLIRTFARCAVSCSGIRPTSKKQNKFTSDDEMNLIWFCISCSILRQSNCCQENVLNHTCNWLYPIPPKHEAVKEFLYAHHQRIGLICGNIVDEVDR